MADVTIENVRKIYDGGVEAVKGINLQIRDGEFIVLVGPSGCGKSTTLRMVAGLEDVTHGDVRIGSRRVNDVAPKDRDIAMVFQNYALYPHMSVYKNMAFGLKLRQLRKGDIQERVSRAAAVLGIEHLLDRKPKALSGGQRQRVAVGRAIVREPAAFLFDEPLSNLDAKLRVQTRAELKHLHKQLATTTIYVTHDQEEAMTLGDRVVVMSEGLIQQCDTPLNVYNHPANRFVAGFLGTPPMNFVDGRLIREGGEVRFRGGGVDLPLPEAKSALAQSHVGQGVVLGIRPEAMFLRPTAGASDERLTVELGVDVVEPLGSLMDVYGTTSGGARVIARVKARELQAGSVRLFVDAEQIHVFESGEFGRNITLASAPEIEAAA